MSANLKDAERPVARGIRETAAIVGMSPGFIRKAIDAGDLKRVRLGRRVLIKDSDLLEWLNRNDDPKTEAA
jgi:excisionase family DNA binding protein